MSICLVIPIILFFWWNYKANYYQPKWSAFIFLCALLMSYHIFLISNWQFATLFFILLSSSIVSGLYDYKLYKNPFIELECSKTTACIFGCGALFLFADNKIITAAYDAIPIILISNALIKFVPYRFRCLRSLEGTTHTIYGVGGNKSTDSSLVSIMAAMMLTHDYTHPIKTIALISAYSAIIGNRATAGAIALNLAVGFWAITLGFPMVAVAIALISVIVALRYRKTILNDSGRIEMWKFIRKYLFVKKYFGIGNGAFKVVMPIYQTKLIKGLKNCSIWAHNDLLQFFVENGYLGLISLVVFLMSVIPDFTLNNWIVFLAIIPNVIFNFSTHMAPDMFLILIALKEHFCNR